MIFKVLHTEMKPLGLQIFWAETKVQWLGGFLNKTVQFVNMCGKDVNILENFTYLASVVENNGLCCQEVLLWTGLVHGIMDSLSRII